MILWRLCHEKAASTANEAFSGDGPVAEAKRWNDPGRRVVYCAASPALALLELLVDMPTAEWPRLVLYRAHVPDGVARDQVAPESLPPDWRDTPAPAALREIGDAWLARAHSALLVVPSAIVPEESNVLVSPEHPDFRRIALAGPLPFVLDRRLLTRSPGCAR